jgi:hypothetical protein
MISVIQKCADDLDSQERDKIQKNIIQEHIEAINKLISTHKNSSSELDDMNSALAKLLGHLAKSIERSQSDFVLKTMGEICSQVAHDMRSPIATIRGFLSFIREDQLKT